MLRSFLRSKIHRATVTDADLNYEGSITIAQELLDASGILPFEQVQVVNVTTGDRLETYAISGGQGVICLNGAAARLAQPGDIVIIMAYARCSPQEACQVKPTVVHVDTQNRPVQVALR